VAHRNTSAGAPLPFFALDAPPSPSYPEATMSPRTYAFAFFYYYGFPTTGRGWRRMRD
jgi:hypothetical protein